MKLSKLGALIKEQKSVTVLNTVADEQIIRQHILLYGAMYPMDGYPLLDKDVLLTILDIPKEKRGDYYYKEENHTESTLRWAEDNPLTDDTEAELLMTTLKLPMETLIPVRTVKGIVYIHADYMQPIRDETETEYFYRQLPQGGVIVAKRGWQTIATIATAKGWATETIANELQDIAQSAAEISQQLKKERQEAVQQMF